MRMYEHAALIECLERQKQIDFRLHRSGGFDI
jgi:hypothetical protein